MTTKHSFIKAINLGTLGLIPGVASIARLVSDVLAEDAKRMQEALLYAQLLEISYEELLEQFQSFPGAWLDFKMFILRQQIQAMELHPSFNCEFMRGVEEDDY